MHRKLISVMEHHPPRVRGYTASTAPAVGQCSNVCVETPTPYDENSPVASKGELTAYPDHPGLCDKAMGATIAFL